MVPVLDVLAFILRSPRYLALFSTFFPRKDMIFALLDMLSRVWIWHLSLQELLFHISISRITGSRLFACLLLWKNKSASLMNWIFSLASSNERGWKYKTLGNACALKAGKGIKASELSEEKAAGLYPCFGGNGIRGYIAKKSHKGTYPIIGRQGALCGNVQLATGEFYATEHAVVCTPGEGLHAVFVYYALLAMNLNQYATGVAQPGLAVKTLLPIPIVTPPMELQERFAEKICNIESQIDLLNVSLEQIDTLFHSRMDYYFND